MTSSVELQIISKLLTTDSDFDIDRLCAFDTSYYAVFNKQIEFILNHREQYGNIPDIFTFQAQFPDITLVQVDEPISYLEDNIRKNKQQILLLQTFNKLADLGSGDVSDAWQYLSKQVSMAESLDTSQPMNIVSDAIKRSEQIIEFNQQERIPTGFPEIDKLLYGGFSTVEEFVVLLARTNAGKTWVCTKMMESAQLNNRPVLYYSPEMRASFIGTRFDTWRGHFKNSEIFRGRYDENYMNYLKQLAKEETGAFVVEDSDMSGGITTVASLENLVKKYHIKMLIVDGLSYLSDGSRITSVSDTSLKYKNIANDLFRLSKKYRCAVISVMQANRESKETKDEKGEPFPTMMHAEGSDHPCRIATQVFSIRQIFDKHILEIRMEKSRTAKNTKPVFSYTWDPNTGTTELLPDGADSIDTNDYSGGPRITTHITTNAPTIEADDFDDEDEDVVF